MSGMLPEEWKKSILKDVVKYQKGKKPNVLNDEPFQDSVPYLDIKAFERGVIDRYADISSSNLVDEKSLIIVWDGARSGWVSKGKSGSIGSTLAKLTPINSDVDYLYYFLKSNFNLLNTNTRGTGIPHVDPDVLWNLEIPLPPLSEQQRLVAKLDALFGSLEQLKSRLNTIPQLLKTFRQAVLTQAVTGKLTREWREGKVVEEWEEVLLRDCADCRLGKMLDKNKNEGNPTKYLRNINVRWFSIDFDDIAMMKVEDAELKKYELKKGDVLVCEGGEPGRAAIWNYEDKDIIYQKALHRIRFNNRVLPEFFLYRLFLDASTQKIDELFTGTTIKHLTGQKFETYSFLLPPLTEQHEIVRRVEGLLSKADAIEARYRALKGQVDALPQAVLGKAFRGELL